MKQAGGGKIINIGSMMSIFGASFAPAYAASKGGIVQFTRSCAVAWAADNIQANAILPGWIDTDLTKRARVEIDGLHDKVLARTPAARWGAIDDFAGIAVFLSSARIGFRHRHCDSRRWRVFGDGVIRRVGKATGRECVRWRAHHSVRASGSRWWARRKSAFAHPTPPATAHAPAARRAR